MFQTMARSRESTIGDTANSNDLPVIFTPFTRMTEHWGTHQKGPCAKRELDWAQCAASVGDARAQTECSKYLEDFLECTEKTKAVRFNKLTEINSLNLECKVCLFNSISQFLGL